MTKRLEEIFSIIPECKVFADIGCDHGYIAKEMLDKGKCQSVIIADISAKCLSKAQELLKDRIENGDCTAVVSNGFEKVVGCDLALIAGMGGEEIISIIKNAKELPKTLVLQPMKNVDKVRRELLQAEYRLEKDYVFFADKKFYDVIVAQKGKDFLTEEEIEFGRDNIVDKNEAFKKRNSIRIALIKKLLSSGDLSDCDQANLTIEMEKLKKYV